MLRTIGPLIGGMLWALAATPAWGDACKKLLASEGILSPESLGMIFHTCAPNVIDALERPKGLDKYELLGAELSRAHRELRLRAKRTDRFFTIDRTVRGVVGKAAGRRPVLGIGLGIANDLINTRQDRALRFLLKKHQLSMEELVARHLATVGDDIRTSWEDTVDMPPERRLRKLVYLTEDIKNALLAGIDDPDLRKKADAVVTTKLLEHSLQSLASLEQIRAARDRYLSAGIEANRTRIGTLAGEVGAFYESYLRYRAVQEVRLGELSRQVTGLYELMNAEHKRFRAAIETNRRLISANSRDIATNRMLIRGALGELRDIRSDLGFINSFVLARMTPEEQLHAIRGGFLTQMSTGARAALVRKLEVVTARRAIAAKIELIGAIGDTFVKIGSAAGMNVSVLKGVKAVSLAGRAIATLVSGGSPLSLLNLVGGLFSLFGGGRDPIMENLHVIVKNQQVMVENQHLIIQMVEQSQENQRRLFENQSRIFKGLKMISDDARRMHQRETAYLAEILSDVLVNRTLVRTNMVKEALDCHHFLDGEVREEYEPGYRQRGHFRDFDNLLQHFDDYRDLFHSCQTGLSRVIANRQFRGGALLLSSYKGSIGPDRFRRLVTGAYHAQVRYLVDLVNDGRRLKTWQKEVSRLTLPVPTVAALWRKNSARAQDLPLWPIPQDLVTTMGQPISAQALLQYAGSAIAMYPYLEMADRRDGDLYTIEELARRRSGSRRGVILIKKLLGVLHYGIAQEAIWAGEPLIAALMEDLRSGAIDPAAVSRGLTTSCALPGKANRAACLVALNPLLAENLVLAQVRATAGPKRSAWLKYHVAYHSPASPAMMGSLLAGPHAVTFAKAPDNPQGKPRWYMVLGGQYHALPSPEVAMAGRMTYRPTLDELVAVRDEVMGMIAQSHAVRRLGRGAMQRLVKRAAFSSVNPQRAQEG